MSKLDELRAKRMRLEAESNRTIDDMFKIAEESRRAADVAQNADKILLNLDDEFENITKLNKFDVTILFSAVAMQCVRRYLLTDFKERLDDKTAAKNTPGHHEEHSDRSHKLYHPSLEQIIANPVPFDAITGSNQYSLGIGGGFQHRARTLGHDPLLGWIFGTMNILTSTITTSDFQSFHVHTGYVGNGNRDVIRQHAQMNKILEYSSKRILNEGAEGKAAFGAALLKEAVHLKSDVNTKASLPIPLVETITPGLAGEIAKYGYDMANVLTISKQACYSCLINTLIGAFHRLFYSENTYNDRMLYEVKTRKILLYSNLIASMSNVIYVAVSAYLGNENAVKKLDIGGFVGTLYRLITDSEFIRQVKHEFVYREFNKLVLNEL